jgi:asparagine N-glycosylation enzyme membrane subunit Stt3
MSNNIYIPSGSSDESTDEEQKQSLERKNKEEYDKIKEKTLIMNNVLVSIHDLSGNKMEVIWSDKNSDEEGTGTLYYDKKEELLKMEFKYKRVIQTDRYYITLDQILKTRGYGDPYIGSGINNTEEGGVFYFHLQIHVTTRGIQFIIYKKYPDLYNSEPIESNVKHRRRRRAPPPYSSNPEIADSKWRDPSKNKRQKK